MKIFASAMLLALALCAGCARHYVITLNNGTQLLTASKPKLVRSNYVFKDARGQQVSVPSGRVREIAPASMVKEEQPIFKPRGVK